MSRELTGTMRELSMVLKALQKTWILDDAVEEVKEGMKKKAKKEKKKKAAKEKAAKEKSESESN